MKFKYYLGLGSNIEPKFIFLQNAVINLNKIGEVKKKSGIYESLAWGNTNQENFLNAVVRFHTDLNPFHLLSEIKEIEKIVGRKTNNEKWGSREIDIDLLFSDNIFIEKDNLKIPHKYFKNRNFVLVPMAELNRDYNPKNNEMNIEYYLNNSTDLNQVELSIENW
jgi:2-amino-4-hydroxy-6-hydroxymethyldihydropteridine diphosphokinase